MFKDFIYILEAPCAQKCQSSPSIHSGLRIIAHKVLHYSQHAVLLVQENRHSESDEIPNGRTGLLSIHEMKLKWNSPHLTGC